jgi:hypothetical protein
MSKECPVCHLLSPEPAKRCDCGHDFSVGKRRERAIPPLWRTVVALAVLLLFDAGMQGQGVLSLFIAFVGVVLLAMGAAWAAFNGAGARARSRLLRAAIYLLFGTATMGIVACHRSMAARNAERVIDACRAYKAEHGDFPDSLSDLIPKYFDAVPRAKLTVAWGEFMYSATRSADGSQKHVLMYRDLPPGGRRLYHLEEARWTTLD